jgi:membrane-associated protease RseP (regulator of RpoE activity)
MDAPESSDEIPELLQSLFHLREVREDDDRILYVGEPLVPRSVLLGELGPAFERAGYRLDLAEGPGTQEVVLVAQEHSPGIDGVPWKNIALFVATLCSTLLVGALGWYYIPVDAIRANPLVVLNAWPFTAAVVGVLSAHELGHYVAGRYHGVDISLPYLIPFILPFGTLGAIIRMRGQMPDRKALFDIGVAGPLAGLVATVAVTAVGLSLPPMQIPVDPGAEATTMVVFNNPPLLNIIATLLNQPPSYADPTVTVHPVVIGGWVGMFFTVLNLLPVGQLDGGHIVRAMLGERQETVAALVPVALFGIAGYLYFVRGLGINDSVGLWTFWGLFASFVAYRGPANPLDETPVDWRRLAVGVLTFALGALCFLLVPIQLVGG